jgi:hypothetical protein
MQILTPRRMGVLAALAAAGAGPALAAPAGASAAPRACQTAQLVTLVSGSSGTAGSIIYTLRFDNLGTTCTLHGFPGVSAVDLKGRQLGRPAVKAGGAGRTITIPGPSDFSFGGATARLQITEAGNFPAARCKPALAAGLRVYPPNQKAAAAVPLPFEACTTRQTFMSVRAVR